MGQILSKTGVDTHFHVFDAHVGHAGARYVPAYDAPMSAWRAVAEPSGVGRGVLVQPSFLGTDNTRLLAELALCPEGLRGIAVVAPDAGAELLHDLHAAGVRGLRLNLAGGTEQRLVEWARSEALWDRVAALGWHLELHTDPGCLPLALARLPADMPLVIDHMGKPAAVSLQDETVRAVARRADRAPVHVKLSAPYRLGGLDPGALARLWWDTLGPRSLLWGSDWPFTNHEHDADFGRLLRDMRSWLPADVLDAALIDNPTRLYWG